MGPAGTRIKEGCVTGNYACGSLQQGYISSGTHPTLLNQRATLTVCFKTWTICSHCNSGSIDIEVINCGSYFVYDLPSIDKCAYAYCTEWKIYNIQQLQCNLDLVTPYLVTNPDLVTILQKTIFLAHKKYHLRT